MHKLNFWAKNKDDHYRNLKVFEDCVKKMKLPFLVPSLDHLSNSKFQYNMECLQLLYNFVDRATKTSDGSIKPTHPKLY